MNRISDFASSDGLRSGRVVQISLRPKSWLGRFALGLAGIAAVALTVLLSVVFFVLAMVAIVGGVLYLRWHARKLRKAMQPDVIEGEVRSRDID